MQTASDLFTYSVDVCTIVGGVWSQIGTCWSHYKRSLHETCCTDAAIIENDDDWLQFAAKDPNWKEKYFQIQLRGAEEDGTF